MDQTANNNTLPSRRRLVIRVSRYSLSFSTVEMTVGECPVQYEPYTVKSGISMAANLREALRTARLPQHEYQRVTVFIDAPVLMVPTDLFNEAESTMLYDHSMSRNVNDTVLHNVLPDLNAVAVFAVNKDLKLVIDDNYPGATFVCRCGVISISATSSARAASSTAISTTAGWTYSVSASAVSNTVIPSMWPTRRTPSTIFFMSGNR